MHYCFDHHRATHFVSALAAMVILTLTAGSCGWFSEKEQDATEPVATPSIELVEGMKYYVGGPFVSQDKYGGMRIRSFDGEVKKPTSRGLVIGYKELEGNRFEMWTFLNGKQISRQMGFLDEDGLLWFDDRRTLNADGKVVVRQTLTYDNDRQIMHSKMEYLDPVDGEVVKTHEADLPYKSDDADDDNWDDEENDEEGGGGDAEQE